MFFRSYFKKIWKSNLSISIRMTSTEGRWNLMNGAYLGYKQFIPTNKSNTPGVIFCSGFESNMNGNKAEHLDGYCKKNNLSYLRFDYIGHKYSSGTMDDFSIGTWKENTLTLLDNLTEGPQILVGSSMGGWVSLLTALERPNRIHSILTIANATDMLYNRFLKATPEERDHFEKTDYFVIESRKFSKQCVEDAKNNALLTSSISIKCPVRLLHGMMDDVVPYQVSVKTAEQLASNDVHVHLVKNADHRFSSEHDLELISNVLDQLTCK